MPRAPARAPSPVGADAVLSASSATPDNDRLPVRELITLSITMLSNSLNISVLFPFVGLMVEHLGMTEDRRELGYYAGYIAGAFMLGRTFTSYFWGLAADKFGRKPVIVIGQVCVILCGIAFGFTFSFEWAVAVRMLSGVMNGIVGTAKASASEVCPEHLQGRAMSYVTTSWGVGLIVGPALGGILSEPATKIPSLFPPDGLFGQFPFLLPMLAVSILTFLAMICTVVYLPETLHRRPPKQAARDPVPSTASAASSHASASSTSSADASPRGAVLVDLDLDLDLDSDQSSLQEGRGSSRGWDAGALTTSSKATPSDAALGTFGTPHRPRQSQRETPASLRTPSQAPTRALQVDHDGEDALSSSPTPHHDRTKPSASSSASASASASTSSSSLSTLATVRDPHGDRRSLLQAEEEDSPGAQSAVASAGSAGASIVSVKAAAGAVGARPRPPKARPRMLCFRLQPMLILVVYTVLSLSSNMMDEILPLWALAERRQYGLGMTSTEVGISLTITGGLITLFQLFVYPPMSSRFSLLAILKATSILQVPFMCAFPLLYYVTQPTLFWAALIALNFFKAALAMCNFITISILTNNSVPRAERGTANGLGMTMASTGRALGPALGGNILAWSLTNGLPWPLSYHFGFYFCALVVLSIYATLLSISETLNHPLPEDDEDEDEGVIKTANSTLAPGARSSEEEEEEVEAAPTSRGRAGGAGALSLHDKDGSVRASGSGAAVRSSEVELAGRTLATTRYEIGDDDSDDDGHGEHEGEGKKATGGEVPDSRRSIH